MINSKKMKHAKAMYLKHLDDMEAVVGEWLKANDFETYREVNDMMIAKIENLPKDESNENIMLMFALYGQAKAFSLFGIKHIDKVEKDI